MKTQNENEVKKTIAMKPQIKIDGDTVTVWRYLPRQRATGYKANYYDSPPGMHGGRFIPRRLFGHEGVVIQETGQQFGLELWTETEKLVMWPAEPLALENIAGVDTMTQCITTKAGISIQAETERKPLSEEEFKIVQQERLIAGGLQRAGAQIDVPGMANLLAITAGEIRNRIYTLNKSYSAKHGVDLFKATNESVNALTTLDAPATDKQKYGELIDSLYILIYEGSGSCNRLGKPVPDFAMDVKFLRTALRHDVDHGDEDGIAKKMKRAGETFLKYSTKQTPEECGKEDFLAVQTKLLACCMEMLTGTRP
jgi:hypothetical protein